MPAPRLVSGAGAFTLLIEYYLIFLIAAICIAGIYLILRSRVGIALAAIRENELEARTAGVDPVKYKLLAFAVSTFIAGIAGALEIHHFGYVTPEVFGTEVSFWPVIYSILGGLGTIAGPIIGTVILTLFWDGLKDIGLTYERFIIIGALLILAVIFLPTGLVSIPERVQEWRKKRSG
jgi:branched-chain amino acid transport system permease protein